MKIGKTKDVEMKSKGCPYYVEWRDGSKSYYESKKIAKQVVEEDADYN